LPAASFTALIAQLDAVLPQTQCTRCGYPSCREYAQAMAANTADINQCPPGGAEGVKRLAALTGRAATPLNSVNGLEGPRSIAIIDEDWCIGCTLCLDACPTDAIVGGNKLMHTVIEYYCTGCELCLPVCPVDCISLENVTGERSGWSAWSQQQAETAKSRYELHSARNFFNEGNSTQTLEDKQLGPATGQPATSDSSLSAAQQKRAVIEAAMARAKAARRP